jgi:hypothetical protein
MSDESNVEKDKVWELLENSFGKRLIPIKGRNSWRTSPDSKVSIFLAYSKYYPEDTRYWYGIRKKDFQNWKNSERFFIGFILGRSNEVILMPAFEFAKALDNSYITPTSGGITRLHILRNKGSFHFLEMDDLNINQYYNNFGQLNITSANDYEDSEYTLDIKEQNDKFELGIPKIFGRGGESASHKQFKEYIASNPHVLIENSDEYEAQVEFTLPSLDSIDVVFTSKAERIGVEVKSHISSIDDITRGLFQCVKYTALLKAYHKAINSELDTKVVLVLESTFPDALKNLRELLEIDVRDNIAINNGS